MRDMEAAIKTRNFAAFAELAMRDSNQFHATCLDTYPPIFYMNDVSRAVILLITKLNATAGTIKYGYTFDAGPNPVLFALDDDMPTLINEITTAFGPSKEQTEQDGSYQFVRGLTNAARSDLSVSAESSYLGRISYLYHTDVGPGARVLSNPDDSLLDASNGMPK